MRGDTSRNQRGNPRPPPGHLGNACSINVESHLYFFTFFRDSLQIGLFTLPDKRLQHLSGDQPPLSGRPWWYVECAFWHKIYIIKELLNLNWSIKFVPRTNSQQVHIFAQIQAGHLERAIIKLYTNATIIYDLLLHCRIFNDAFIVTLPPTTSSFIGSLLELLLSHSLTFLSKCPLMITFIHLTHKPMIICYQNHTQTKVLPIQILGHSLTSHYKGLVSKIRTFWKVVTWQNYDHFGTQW